MAEKAKETAVINSAPTNLPPYGSEPPPGLKGPAVITQSPTAIHVGTGVVPVLVTRQAMGSKASRVTCPSCQHEILTKVEAKNATKTHLFAGLLCLLGCWCCICIPYCTDSCKNIDHYCPDCNAYIGSYAS